MSDLRSLIEAAKADAPTATVRAKVWAGVSSVVGEAAAATGAAALAGSASAVKMLIFGTLLGGSLTVGIGGALLFMGPTPNSGAATAGMEMAPVRSIAAIPISESMGTATSREVLDSAPIRPVVGSSSAPSSVSTRAQCPHSAKAQAGHATSAAATHAASHDEGDDALAREASMLASARSALSRSDALSALQTVRRLRALPAAQLMPEELAVEAQALRALGLDSDADQVDTTLRSRFPDSVLGR